MEGGVGPVAVVEGVACGVEVLDHGEGLGFGDVVPFCHDLDAVVEWGDESDVDAGGHVVGDEDGAEADEEDVSGLGECVDGLDDAAEDGEFAGVIVGVAEAIEEIADPGVAGVLEGVDEGCGEVVVFCDAFDEFAVEALPPPPLYALPYRFHVVESFGEECAEGAAASAGLAADGDERPWCRNFVGMSGVSSDAAEGAYDVAEIGLNVAGQHDAPPYA